MATRHVAIRPPCGLEPDQRDTHHGPEPKTILADGGADGRWGPGDDDAKLWGSINSILPWEFVDRMANPQTIFMPWGGSNVGDV